MRKGTILPIALMAFAIVAFLFLVTYAVTPGLKYPWSTNQSKVVPECHVTGYHSEVCMNGVQRAVASPDRPEYACYSSATCVPQPNNVCGWTMTQELQSCIDQARAQGNTTSNTNAVTNTSPTADWKTYTNTTYGFSFRYPKNFATTESSVELYDLTKNIVSVGDSTRKDYRSMSVHYIHRQLDPKNVYTAYNTGLKAKQVNIADRAAYTISGSAGGAPLIVYQVATLDNSAILEFEFGGAPSNSSDNPTGIVYPWYSDAQARQQILDTIIFSIPTTGWKTYTNTTFGYSVQYPVTYALKGTDEQIALDLQDYANGNVAHLSVFVADGTNDEKFGPTGNGLAVIDWITTARNGFPASEYMTNKRTTTIHGKKFVTFDYDLGSSGSVLYFYVQGKKVYIIQDTPGGAGNKNFNPLELGRILPTFTFTK